MTPPGGAEGAGSGVRQHMALAAAPPPHSTALWSVCAFLGVYVCMGECVCGSNLCVFGLMCVCARDHLCVGLIFFEVVCMCVCVCVCVCHYLCVCLCVICVCVCMAIRV